MAFKTLLKNDSEAAKVIEQRMKKLVKLQVGGREGRHMEEGVERRYNVLCGDGGGYQLHMQLCCCGNSDWRPAAFTV